MKLELKHLAPYLPYGLKGVYNDNEIMTLSALITEPDYDAELVTIYHFLPQDENSCKPILRPLSDLTKEIEYNGEKFIPAKKIGMDVWRSEKEASRYVNGMDYRMLFGNVWHNPMTLHYSTTVKLLEWHFDVFGLIEAGLAMDINKIEK